MAQDKKQQAKKKERERRVAKEKLKEQELRRSRESGEEKKPASSAGKIMSAAVPKPKPLTVAKPNLMHRRTGG